ncbi:MAG TPA: S28 family serine protease [Flavisolibacter sp.]|jgi:hypothetical protein|nr:S28 family serine protease [Flavisolibacter sp.]
MKSFLSIILLLWTLQSSAQSEQEKLEQLLFNLPNVQFRLQSGPKDKYLKYLLTIRQPLDHEHPEKGTFNQYAVLTHKGFDRPTVMETEGYEVHYGGNELEAMLDANNINVEHRFFGASRPDSLQWDYLTFEQVTADLHDINQLFRTLYKHKWVSTGISRGGLMSIYYKYFYPEDVDLTVPYVAPLTRAVEDKRIYHFLDTIGTAECRTKLFNVQRFLLEHEKEAVAKLRWYAMGKGLTFDYFGSLEKAFEYWILEYPFSFWQLSNMTCEQIPENKNVEDYLEHTIKVGGIQYLSDKYINQWVANAYTALTQMGYYSYDLTRYRKYLKHIKGENPTAAFLPRNISARPFDSSFSQRISNWLNENGNNILYIYGSRDTWSACRVLVSGKVNSQSFLLPGANHFEARVRNMPAPMKADFASSVRNMLGLEPRLEALK